MIPFKNNKVLTYKPEYIKLQSLLRLKGFVPRYVIKYIAERNNSHVSIGNVSEDEILDTGEALKELITECKREGYRNIDAELDAVYGPQIGDPYINVSPFRDNVTEKDFTAREMKIKLSHENRDKDIIALETLPNQPGSIFEKLNGNEKLGNIVAADPSAESSRIASLNETTTESTTIMSVQPPVATECQTKEGGAAPANYFCKVCLRHSTDCRPDCQVMAFNNKFCSPQKTQDLSRLEVIYQNENNLHITSLCPDSGCNVNLMSLSNYLRMGGKESAIIMRDNLSLSNSTNSNVKNPLKGTVTITVYVIHQKKVYSLGALNWLIIDSDLNENLLSVTELRRLNATWDFAGEEKISLDGFNSKGELERIKLSLGCLKRTLSNTSYVKGDTGKQLVRFKYLSCNYLSSFDTDNQYFKAEGQVSNDNIEMRTPRFPSYDNLFRFVEIEIFFYSKRTFQRGQINIEMRYSQNFPYVNHHNLIETGLTVPDCYISDNFMEDQINNKVEIKDPLTLTGVKNEKMDLDHLSEDRRKQVEKVVNQNRDAFSLHQYDVGLYRHEEFRLPHNGKVHADAYRPITDPRALEATRTEIERLTKCKIIKEVTHDETRGYNNSIFTIPKDSRSNLGDKMIKGHKDRLHSVTKKFRTILDGRSLSKNALGVKETFYPKIEQLTQQLKGKYCIVADLSLAFYSLKYHPDDTYITSFRFENRFYQFLRSIMGDCRSSNFLNKSVADSVNESKWEEYKLARGLDMSSLINYFSHYADDLYIFNETWEGLMEVFNFVLKCMSSAGFKLSKNKTLVSPPSFKILGYQFDAVKDKTYTMSIPQEKLQQVFNWPRPHNKRYLSSRLSTIGYFSRNLPAIKSSISYLYCFLRSRDNEWDEKLELEWCIFVCLLRLSLKLNLFDSNKDAILCTDASLNGASCVLLQNECDDPDKDPIFKVVNCGNKLFSQTEARRAPVRKELLSLIYGLQCNEYYLRSCSKRILILTDAKSISYLMKTKNLSEGLVAAANYLASFSQEIIVHHLPGSVNHLADLLSRQFVEYDESYQSHFSHDLAEQLSCGLFKAGDILDMESIAELTHHLPSAEYLRKGGKTPVPKVYDILRYSLKMERPPEHEYLAALKHKDYSRINNKHPIYLNMCKTAKARGHIIKSEFDRFIESRNNDEICDFLKTFYHEAHVTSGGESVSAGECLHCLTYSCEVARQPLCRVQQTGTPDSLPVTMYCPPENPAECILMFNTARLNIPNGNVVTLDLNVVLRHTGALEYNMNDQDNLKLQILSRYDDGSLWLDKVVIYNYTEKDQMMSDNVEITITLESGNKFLLLPEITQRSIQDEKMSNKLAAYFSTMSNVECRQAPHHALRNYCSNLSSHCPDSHTLRVSKVLTYDNTVRGNDESDDEGDEIDEDSMTSRVVQPPSADNGIDDEEDDVFDPAVVSTPTRGRTPELDANESDDGENPYVLNPEITNDTTEQEDGGGDESLNDADNNLNLDQRFSETSRQIAIENVNNSLVMSHIMLRGNVLTLPALKKLQRSSKYLESIIRKCEARPLRGWGGFFLDQNDILFKERKCKKNFQTYPVICLPSYLGKLIIQNCHHRHNFHLKTSSMYAYLSGVFYCNNLLENIKQIEASCLSCRHSSATYRREILGERRTVSASVPGAHLYADVSQSLPPTPNGYRHYILYVDAATGMTFAYCLRTLTAEESLTTFQHLSSFLPNIKRVTSDGGSVFRNPFSCWLFRQNVVHHRYTSRAQSNGLAEIYVKITKYLLNSAVHSVGLTERNHWDKTLYNIVNYLNGTPSHAAQGNRMSRRALFFNKYNTSIYPSINRLDGEILQTLKDLKDNRDLRLRQLASQYKIPEFQLYDLVAVKKSKDELNSLYGQSSHLQPTSTQMYRIIGLGPVSARLQSLVDNSRVSVAINKLVHYQPSDAEILESYQSLLPNTFAKNLFHRGSTAHPNVFTINDINGPTQLRDHLLLECDPRYCQLVQNTHNNSGEGNNYVVNLRIPPTDGEGGELRADDLNDSYNVDAEITDDDSATQFFDVPTGVNISSVGGEELSGNIDGVVTGSGGSVDPPDEPQPGPSGLGRTPASTRPRRKTAGAVKDYQLYSTTGRKSQDESGDSDLFLSYLTIQATDRPFSGSKEGILRHSQTPNKKSKCVKFNENVLECDYITYLPFRLTANSKLRIRPQRGRMDSTVSSKTCYNFGMRKLELLCQDNSNYY